MRTGGTAVTRVAVGAGRVSVRADVRRERGKRVRERGGRGAGVGRGRCSPGESGVLTSLGGLIFLPGGKPTGEGRFRAKGLWDARGRQQGRWCPDSPG